MIRPIVFLMLCLGMCFSFAAGSAHAEAGSDTDLRSRLAGRWQEFRLLENEKDQQIMEIKSNGKFEVQGVANASGIDRPFIWRGTWDVKNGNFIYKTTYSDYVEAYPVGEEFKDRVVSITSTEWRMIEGSTGNESRAKRIE